LPDIELISLSASEAATEIARGAISAEDYTAACLERITAVEPEVQAFAHLDPDHALAQARALDRQKAEGQRIGPLHGIPVGIKDIFDTADYPTEYGSPIFAGNRPGADCAAVRKLREAGAVILGKTVSTEFAYYHPGKTRNPRDLTRTPGGSSSGSAAAVAAGMVPLSIGSQTNGSMIRPASFCGVFGIKPTYGLISRAGALTLSRTLDHVGAYARSVEDLALILEVLVGQDPADPDTKAYAAPGFAAAVAEPSPLPPSFAFVRTPMWDKADAAARAAIEDFAKEVGAREVELPPDYASAWGALRAIMAVEMAHNLGPHLEKGEASQQFRDLVAEGRSVTAVQYLAAKRDARRYAEGMMGIFEQVADAIITLPAGGVAPQGIGATGDPVFCTLWTLVGFPALNVPLLESSEGLPIGIQLIGAPGRDERLLRTARTLIASLGEAG
jgi:Asp-tRNA(Asn)/Glu-tRNA(Gln) amidotransferase A subunit family amidase